MTKSHFSNQSHLKTQTSSQFEKKNAVYYFQIHVSLFFSYLMDISANLKLTELCDSLQKDSYY